MSGRQAGIVNATCGIQYTEGERSQNYRLGEMTQRQTEGFPKALQQWVTVGWVGASTWVTQDTVSGTSPVTLPLDLHPTPYLEGPVLQVRKCSPQLGILPLKL